MSVLINLSRPVEENPVHPDEPCWALAELFLLPEDMHERHRYQLVNVVRGDERVWIRIDMGLESEWLYSDQFRVMANGDPHGGDTVASVQAYADMRREDMYWQKFLEEQQAESTLIPDMIRWHEERRLRILNRSQFGPGGHKQRNNNIVRRL